MDENIKALLSFLTVDEPELLLTPCSFRNEDWINEIGARNIRCTATKCEEEDKECITMHPTGLYLPMNKFDIWIIDPEEFPYTIGYAFYLGKSAMKQFGIIALTSMPDDAMDSIALSYGFQILYHGTWHYYLKSS